MSTRGHIIKKESDGTYRKIYVGHDSYPAGVGFDLLSCYQNDEKIGELMDLGNISSLGETIEKCSAFGRDRGEAGEEAEIFLDDKHIFDYQECYTYLWDGEQWFIYNSEKPNCKELLTIEICKLYNYPKN